MNTSKRTDRDIYKQMEDNLNDAIEEYRSNCQSTGSKERPEIANIKKTKNKLCQLDRLIMYSTSMVTGCKDESCGCTNLVCNTEAINLARVLLGKVSESINKTASNLFLMSLLFFKDMIKANHFCYFVAIPEFTPIRGQFKFFSVCRFVFLQVYEIGLKRLSAIQAERRRQLSGEEPNPFMVRNCMYDIYGYTCYLTFDDRASKMFRRLSLMRQCMKQRNFKDEANGKIVKK